MTEAIEISADAAGQGRVQTLAWAVVAALLGCAATSVWAIVVELDRASYANGLRIAPTTFVESEASAMDHRVQIANISSLALLAVTGVLFIMWLYRLVRRLERTRGGLIRHRAGWAIGGWFVPFLNLVWPKQMVDDSWRATAQTPVRGQRVPLHLHFWWAAWLLSSILGFRAGLAPRDTLQQIVDADRFSAGDDALSVLAALLAVAVVIGISRRASLVPDLPAGSAALGTMVFNPPPGWPTPPPGWQPPSGWQPDPSWPPAPAGWTFWVPRQQPGVREQPQPPEPPAS
jgi:hypothetical protein